MFGTRARWTHYGILVVAHLVMTLPNLGAHEFWDMDEGVNAEATRELLESGNWITPYYNYEIRTAKPIFLYWLEAPSYLLFGTNEWAARFPAVLCGLGTVLLTYEIGRRLFSPSTGLLSALALASSLEFCLISHAATPDPPLLLFFTASLFFYVAGSERGGRWWFVPTAIACGLATLTKGPIGVALPGAIIVTHLALTRDLRRLWDRRFLWASLAFVLVAGPWYGLVALDTKGKWIQGFFLHDNLKRFTSPAENHSGLPIYHAATLMLLFGPWSTYLIPAIWYGVRAARRPQNDAEGTDDGPGRYRLFLAWFSIVLLLFSIAATKLPNYVLPLYPAISLLTGRFLDRWRLGLLAVPPWVVVVSGVGVVVAGAVTIVGFAVVSGTIPVSLEKLHPLPALAPFAPLGAILLLAGLGFLVLARRGHRERAIQAFTVGAVAFLATMAALPTVAMNEYKVARYFAQDVGLCQPDRDIRIGAAEWHRHSIVFYCRREVTRLTTFEAVQAFLAVPRPAYLIVPADKWDLAKDRIGVPTRVIARRYDFLARADILVVANEAAGSPK